MRTGRSSIRAAYVFGWASDQAYPTLIRETLPVGLRGILFAALFGAVQSSLDSMLNSASTIPMIDLYKRHLRPDASPRRLVTVGRIATGVFVLLACGIAPALAHAGFGGIFEYIQKFQGFISPGIVAVFLFGLVARRAPPVAAIGVVTIALYIVFW